jgi:hypothetical protein
MEQRPFDQYTLVPENVTTLPHFSVSSTMNLPNSSGELTNAWEPQLAINPLILGSARPALISLLSPSMISVGVFRGAPTQLQLQFLP